MTEVNYIQQAQAQHMTGRVDMNDSEYNKVEAGHRFDDDGEQRNSVHFQKEVQPELQRLHNDYELANAAYDEAIADAKKNGNYTLAHELRQEQSELQAAYRMCVDRPPGLHRSNAQFEDMWEARLDTLDDQIGVAMARLDGNPDTVVSSTHTVSTEVAPVNTELTSIPAANTAGADATQSESNSAADSSDWVAFADGDVDEMVDLLTSDPEALMEKFKSVPPDQRPLILASIQQKLQEINQMTTMMSNFQKSMHDTQKAVLNNFRV